MPDVMTIREAVQRSKAEGIPISEYTLRRWVKTGAIPTRNAGKKKLLFYPNLVRFLQCEDNNPPADLSVCSGIRRLEVKL